jgi:hypothetical protein
MRRSVNMLFFSKKVNKAGCASVGVVVCATIGYNTKKWSA